MSSEVGMSGLTDDELSTLYYKGYASKLPEKGCHRAGLRAVADAAVAAYVAGMSEPVYAFRRKGFDDFCTCTKERYDELSARPNLFEVAVFYKEST